MKHPWSRLVAFLSVLMLSATTALAATDSMEMAIEKMGDFYDYLVEWNVIFGDDLATDGFPSPEQVQKNTYDFTDYLYADIIVSESDGLIYNLSLAHADLPENLNADDLYALFIKACSNQEMTLEEAQALVAEVRGNMARVDLYSQRGGKDTDEFTISILSSTTDSEEFLVIAQYP